MILNILINCTVVIQLTDCKMQSFKYRKPFPLFCKAPILDILDLLYAS